MCPRRARGAASRAPARSEGARCACPTRSARAPLPPRWPRGQPTFRPPAPLTYVAQLGSLKDRRSPEHSRRLLHKLGAEVTKVNRKRVDGGQAAVEVAPSGSPSKATAGGRETRRPAAVKGARRGARARKGASP